jgi:Mg-chelatase subunit ChlD
VKIALSFFLILTLNLGCSKKEFKPLAPGLNAAIKSSNGEFCEPTVTDVKATTFYIFIVDISGSQDKNDHNGILRFTPIFDFVRSHEGNPDDKFSLILFNDNASVKIELTDHEKFETELTNFWLAQPKGWEDVGFSKMSAGLTTARMILEEFAQEHQYEDILPYAGVQIVVLSDGYPKIETGEKFPSKI